MLDILKGFLPWILFFVLMGSNQTQMDIAIITAAITAVFLEIEFLKKGFILSWGTLIFFLFMTITVVIFRMDAIIQYASVLSHAVLASIAAVSLLVRKPFTIQYAKLEVDKVKWETLVFIRINYILTTIWLIIFLIGLVLSIVSLNVPSLDNWVFNAVTYLPSICGIWITSWFPGWYRSKGMSRG